MELNEIGKQVFWLESGEIKGEKVGFPPHVLGNNLVYSTEDAVIAARGSRGAAEVIVSICSHPFRPFYPRHGMTVVPARLGEKCEVEAIGSYVRERVSEDYEVARDMMRKEVGAACKIAADKRQLLGGLQAIVQRAILGFDETTDRFVELGDKLRSDPRVTSELIVHLLSQAQDENIMARGFVLQTSREVLHAHPTALEAIQSIKEKGHI